MSKYSIDVGGVKIGGGADISIQSMTNTQTSDIEATVNQINDLKMSGCEIVRLAVCSEEDVSALDEIISKVNIPIVADIQFDYKLAIGSIEHGVHKIRINPGNIGTAAEVKQIADCAKMHKIPIRVGVNGGSLEEDVIRQYSGVCADALAHSALKNVSILEKLGFNDICVSIKSSDVKTTIDANTLIAKSIDYPLHLGVTEAGTYKSAAIKSSAALAPLLLGGIGDTIRVSVSGDPKQEIGLAKNILNLCNIRRFSPVVISCPTCARSGFDVLAVASEIEKQVSHIDKPLTIAVMGCIVNGIGEGKHADIGIAGGQDKCALFAKGEYIKTIKNENAAKEILNLIENGELKIDN